MFETAIAGSLPRPDLQHLASNRIFQCTDCGVAPMSAEVAVKKPQALAKGAALARQRYGQAGAGA